MLQVLFVDDEPAVLEGLRDVLRARRREWHMRFVASAGEALHELASQPADVVVTDLRMPGMDGAALLRELSRQRIDAILIILSGNLEEALATGVVHIAHAVLSKPCDPEALSGAINMAREAPADWARKLANRRPCEREMRR